MSTEAKCPFRHMAGEARSGREWWPSQLNLKILRQNASLSDPMREGFDYAEAFRSLDLAAVKKDLEQCGRGAERFFPGTPAGKARRGIPKARRTRVRQHAWKPRAVRLRALQAMIPTV
jgi:hypothetical protein